MKYTLSNGWTIEKQQDKSAVLHVLPLSNSIFRTEKYVSVSDEVYQAVKSGCLDIKELFKTFQLHNQIIDWRPVTKDMLESGNSSNKWHGRDFIVRRESGKCYLEYLLGQQGGGEKCVEISPEIFKKIENSLEMNISEVMRKYGLSDL